MEVTYSQPQVELSQTLGRFGRVTDHRWTRTSDSTLLDRFAYAYDRAGNRTQRDNLLAMGMDEVYTYDELHRLASMDRGTLSGGSLGGPTFGQDWGLDALGEEKWSGVVPASGAAAGAEGGVQGGHAPTLRAGRGGH